MYYIINEDYRFFAGFTGNCFVWKNHHSRAAVYGSKKVAIENLQYYREYGEGGMWVIHESQLEYLY